MQEKQATTALIFCLEHFVYVSMVWTCGVVLLCATNRLRSSYIRCIKLFFKYPKYYSVTSMLLELGLPSFDTLVHNSRVRF